jgi:arylamine N-acetyltransferase
MTSLDAYFARIGYEGPRTSTLATLRALHELHPAAIPFEAIDVLLERGVDLSPEAVEAKLITARRGGYCFEQNGLFQRVLAALGFEVEPLIARAVWMAPPDAQARYGLSGSRLAVRHINGTTTREILDADGIERALIEVFGLPVQPDWRPILVWAAASDGV